MIRVFKFKKNDLNPSAGKQIEYSVSDARDFFQFSSDEVTVQFRYLAGSKENPLNSLKFFSTFKLSPARGDYKCYTNLDGSINLKSFFLGKLNLTVEDNIDDFYALKRNSETDYVLAYFPKDTSFSEVASFFFSDNISNGGKSFDNEISPIILYGPPGTGKTHSLQMDYVRKFDDGLVEFTTFHQSFSYEEFVEGLKPILDDESENVKYTIEKGVFYNVCEKASQLAGYNSLKECINDDATVRQERFQKAIEEKKLALLCIDEINRGNVASIFGDLISLIEPSKRLGAEHELTLTLPYSKQRFGVPANLVIVGTMNTADRSIQLLDSALRRRFRFQECPPVYQVIQTVTAREVLKSINSRIRAILNKDNQIGHSYLMHATTNVEILTALVDKIIPLLEEYFYNNVTKIRFVLNDTGKTEPHFYVEDNDAKKAARKYSDIDIDTEEVDFFELNPDLKAVIKQNNEEEAKRYLDIIIGE